MKKIVALIFILAFVYTLQHYGNNSLSPSKIEPHRTVQVDSAESDIATAFKNQASDIEVEGVGRVIKILADDNAGSRHQKFLLETPSQHTILIAHNIDLAPRIENLQIGDTVHFKGEYEWNAKGGVVHWTHHDPQSRHSGGWLESHGKRHQ